MIDNKKSYAILKEGNPDELRIWGMRKYGEDIYKKATKQMCKVLGISNTNDVYIKKNDISTRLFDLINNYKKLGENQKADKIRNICDKHLKVEQISVNLHYGHFETKTYFILDNDLSDEIKGIIGLLNIITSEKIDKIKEIKPLNKKQQKSELELDKFLIN